MKLRLCRSSKLSVDKCGSCTDLIAATGMSSFAGAATHKPSLGVDKFSKFMHQALAVAATDGEQLQHCGLPLRAALFAALHRDDDHQKRAYSVVPVIFTDTSTKKTCTVT
jgi:hypothetical protein